MSDIAGKTLALLRRLLVGNGYKLEDIALSLTESRELALPGRLAFELKVNENFTKTLGLPRTRQAHSFERREEAAQFITNFRSEAEGNPTWTEEIRQQLAKTPAQGWGVVGHQWNLSGQQRRCALVVPCDTCRGQKIQNCPGCGAQREIFCQTCQGHGMSLCPGCNGSGGQPGKPCAQCQGRARVTCPACRGRGRVTCPQCQGKAVIGCLTCQSHGFFTEETELTLTAFGRFEPGSLPEPPAGVTELIDRIGISELPKGHATISLAPEQQGAGLNYLATMPYGLFRLQLPNHEPISLKALGNKPILADLPPVLDMVFAPLIDKLHEGNLIGFARKYRMIRELCDALGRGQRPGSFFSRNYPFGLSAEVAFALADRIKGLFSTLSQRPRSLVGAVFSAVSAGLYYNWLYNPRPGFLPLAVPTAMWDISLLLLLAGLGWLAVSLTGQKVLTRALPINIRFYAAGGKLALATAGAILAAGLLFLLLPDTRPEWMAALLS